MTVCAYSQTHSSIPHAVSPVFSASQYDTSENQLHVEVHLAAPILAVPSVPAFTGSIEVDVTAEDDPRQNAEFGMPFSYEALVCTLLSTLAIISLTYFTVTPWIDCMYTHGHSCI